MNRTATQLKNEQLLTSIANKVGGAIFDVRSALDMLSVFRTRTVNQVTKMRGDFQMGDVSFGVYTYGKVAMVNVPSLKKYSIMSEESVEPDTMEVKMERTYFNKQGDQVCAAVIRFDFV